MKSSMSCFNSAYFIHSWCMNPLMSPPQGFSKHNLIKTRIRARLQTKNVNTLMKISIDTPDLSHIDDFNFSRAFVVWCSMKDRVISNV